MIKMSSTFLRQQQGKLNFWRIEIHAPQHNCKRISFHTLIISSMKKSPFKRSRIVKKFRLKLREIVAFSSRTNNNKKFTNFIPCILCKSLWAISILNKRVRIMWCKSFRRNLKGNKRTRSIQLRISFLESFTRCKYPNLDF